MVKKVFTNNSIDRHSAITDGIFAIAMTILVLEIAVPTIADISSSVALNKYFIEYLIPSILIYFMSFYLVYNFWESTVILFSFRKIRKSILMLNVLSMATVCLIPFATGFLFKFYKYTNVNLFFSSLILVISLLYLLIFLLLIRDNFSQHFDKKDEIKSKIKDTYNDGVELNNLKLYVRGVTLTLFYMLLSPVISSIISIILAFISPLASLLSFLLILILRTVIPMRRVKKDHLEHIELSSEEKELVNSIRESIYGE